MKFAPIAHFSTKSDKSNKMHENSNRLDGSSEDKDVENEEYEEKLEE